MNKHIVKHIVSVGPSKSGLMNKAQGTKNGPSKSGLMNKHIVKHIVLGLVGWLVGWLVKSLLSYTLG